MAKAYTGDDRAVREDLLDVITNIDPVNNKVQSMLKTSEASSTIHEWPVDTLKTPGANAQVEGHDAAFAARTNPTRQNNRTQIIAIEFDVTDTERAVNAAGFEDRYAYEMRKAMKEYANDTEFALVRGGLASGNNSTARQMVGLKGAITTYATSQSGVSLSEQTLNDYIENTWVTGGNVDTILVPMRLKRRISGFTAGSTKFTEVTDKKLVNVVNVYEADASDSPIKVFPHRFVTTSGDVNFDIIGIEADKYRVAYLNGRRPKHTPLAKIGSSTRGMVEGELTLEYLAEKSSFLGQKHL